MDRTKGGTSCVSLVSCGTTANLGGVDRGQSPSAERRRALDALDQEVEGFQRSIVVGEPTGVEGLGQDPAECQGGAFGGAGGSRGREAFGLGLGQPQRPGEPEEERADRAEQPVALGRERRLECDGDSLAGVKDAVVRIAQQPPPTSQVCAEGAY